MGNFIHYLICGQSYNASTLVNYDSRVVSISNLLVIKTLESLFTSVNVYKIGHCIEKSKIKKTVAGNCQLKMPCNCIIISLFRSQDICTVGREPWYGG